MALKSVLGGWLDEETGIVHRDAADAWRAPRPEKGLPTISALRLIQLLSEHVAKQGHDVPVVFGAAKAPVVRCWLDEDNRRVELNAS